MGEAGGGEGVASDHPGMTTKVVRRTARMAARIKFPLAEPPERR
ncbi:hypothetical protein V1279_001150 [Bradyrhizobium sp. AZCC 1610]